MGLSTQEKRQMTVAVNNMIAERRFSVARKGKDVWLIKMVGGRPVTVVLKYLDEGYWLEPPSHEYQCSYSHFDYTEPETRYTRRKTVIIQLVAQLKKTGLWKFIVNKNFFEPNKANKKIDKELISSQFNEMLRG